MSGKIGVLILLILCNSLFAATEIALISVNQNRLRKKAEEGDKRAVLLRQMVENPNNLLATIQIGISIIALFSGAFAAESFADSLTDFLIRAGVDMSPSALTPVSVVVITMALAYFELVFGELAPKRIAMKKADSIALVMITPIYTLSRLMKPFVKILSLSTNFFAKVLGGVDLDAQTGDVTEEEIRLILDAGGDTGAIDETEMEMINNVFEFNDKTADDICTHRTDIIALPADADEEELIHVLENEKFSRIPVFEDSIDDIIGILHIKDVMKYIINNNLHEMNLRELIRKPHFVPFSVKTDELFEDMQKNKIHVAVVLDEYSGTLGIVTMEDLIEEVMGNIFDEYDEEEKPDIVDMSDNTYIVNGGSDLAEIADYFDVDLPVEDYNTLSGFIISQLGRIPADANQPEITYNGLLLKVSKVEEKRVTEVMIRKTE
ncbi:MAG: hemolysin family protein [Clostridiales bacterium]|nr:hemolysin family protein [Clostridiales bacterium]